MNIEATKQALEELKRGLQFGSVTRAIALLETAIEQAEKQGCDFCNHPQYAGTKCKNCGRETAAPVQPVALPDLPLTPYQRADGAPLWDTHHLHAYALRYAGMLTTPPAAQPAPLQEPNCDRSACGDFSPGPCDNPGCPALRTPPAAPVQEPVAQCMEHGECFGGECTYTTPPAAPLQEPVASGTLDLPDLFSRIETYANGIKRRLDSKFYFGEEAPAGLNNGPIYSAAERAVFILNCIREARKKIATQPAQPAPAQEPTDEKVIALATRYGLDVSMIGALRNFADAYHGRFTAQQEGPLSWQRIELSKEMKQSLTSKASFIPGLSDTTPPASPSQNDLPDFIAGALGVSRGTAYDMMCDALKEAAPLQEQGQSCYCPNCEALSKQLATQESVASANAQIAAHAKRLALDLECLLLSCKESAAVSKWWASAHQALGQYQDDIERLYPQEHVSPLGKD